MGFGALHGLAYAGVPEFALDRGHQAREITLLHVVVHTFAHCQCRFAMGHHPGIDDEGYIAPGSLDCIERQHRIQLRHGFVRNHQIPLCRMQRVAQGMLGVHATGNQVVAFSRELRAKQFDIEGRIVDKQKA